MKRREVYRFLSLFLSLMLVFSCSFGVHALALGRSVEIKEQKLQAEEKGVLSELVISQVDAPQAGATLDTQAEVASAEGVSWAIPVLWVSETGVLTEGTADGQSLLPILVFYLPAGHVVKSADGSIGAFTVTLDEAVSSLFGENGLVSVYDAATGISYILSAGMNREKVLGTDGKLPADSIPGLPEEFRGPGKESYEKPVYVPDNSSGSEENPAGVPTGDSRDRTLVDIHCAQTARDAFTDEDLDWLADLIINSIQPQAVNLLLDAFPAFRTAADQGELGTQIGLYIFFEKGDKDGISAHENAPSGTMAYVGAGYWKIEGENRYGYLIGVDVSAFTRCDEDNEDNYIRDPETGKYILNRSEKACTDLDNTLVHEMLHAFMADYNRTGSAGATDPRFLTGDVEGYTQEELYRLYNDTRLPVWFKEGLASAVENVYQFRYDSFQLLSYFNEEVESLYTRQNLLTSYVTTNFTLKGNSYQFYYDLESADRDDVPNTPAQYVSGYLAALYLGQMAAMNNGMESAIKVDEEGYLTSVSSETIRSGLNTILERMHKGETLDTVIADISNKRYKSTDDFAHQFIKGEGTDEDDESVTYRGDVGENGEGSLPFCVNFLNYMRVLARSEDMTKYPNGSVLFDFDRDFATPIDNSLEATSDFYRIVESSNAVKSTVPDSTALSGGGKSRGGSAPGNTAALAKAETEDAELISLLPAETELTAAKRTADQVEETEVNRTAIEHATAVPEPEPAETGPAAEVSASEKAAEGEQPAENAQPAEDAAENELPEAAAEEDSVTDGTGPTEAPASVAESAPAEGAAAAEASEPAAESAPAAEEAAPAEAPASVAEPAPAGGAAPAEAPAPAAESAPAAEEAAPAEAPASVAEPAPAEGAAPAEAPAPAAESAPAEGAAPAEAPMPAAESAPAGGAAPAEAPGPAAESAPATAEASPAEAPASVAEPVPAEGAAPAEASAPAAETAPAGGAAPAEAPGPAAEPAPAEALSE